MTRLEARKRKKIVQRLHSPQAKPSLQKQVIPVSASKSLLQRLFYDKSTMEKDTQARPIITKQTERLMSVVTEDLIRDAGGSCSMDRVAMALVGHYDVGKSHADSQDRNMLFRTIRKIRNTMSLKLSTASVERRYQLRNALNKATSARGSLSTMVESWEMAKEFLSKEMDFEEIKEGYDVSVEQRIVPYHTPSPVTVPFQPDENELPQPSAEKWQQISAYRLPQKIQELTIEDKGAIEKEMEIQQAEREAQRLSELEDIERQSAEREREEDARKAATSMLRDFTDEEDDIVWDAVHGAGSSDEVLQKEGTDFVTRSSMQKLAPGQWLGDEAIHFFLLMLAKRDEELCRADPNRKRCHFFKSFFVTKLLNEGHQDPEQDGQYEYRNVKRWSKKVPGKDIFKLDKIVFPINQGRMHWVCAVAFMQEKRIQFYDSMGADGIHYLEQIFRYIQDEHQDKKKSPLPDKDEWQLVACALDTPRQTNGFDCGVFCCTFADFLSMDYPLTFNQDHINKCRKRIALSIMLGQAII